MTSVNQSQFQNPEVWASKFYAEEFSGVSSNEWYDVKGIDEGSDIRLAAKREFLANEHLREPALTYPKLYNGDSFKQQQLIENRFRGAERTYDQLLVQADNIEDKTKSDANYERAAQKLAELYRHKEVMRRLGGVSREALSRERASTMTLEIFGEPEREDFAHILSSIRANAQSQANNPIAKELLSLTGEITPESKMPNYELTDETLRCTREGLAIIFPGFLDISIPVTDANYTPVEIAMNMQKMLDYLGMTESGWVAKTVPGTTAASTSATNKEITIGEGRPPYTANGTNGTSIHEVVGHAFRSRNEGARPGSLSFEEGFATALEQAVTGNKRMAGEQYYLSLGLQLGLDRSGRERDFRDTFEIIWRKILLANGSEPTIENVDDARNKAYAQCMRTTRGAALDARDISYFVGAKNAYTWLNQAMMLPELQRVDKLRWVLSNAFDPTNPEHVRIINGDLVPYGEERL